MLIVVKKLSNGVQLYKERNECGGWTYYTDAISGGAVVFDTCFSSVEEIQICLADYTKMVEEKK